MICSLVNHSDFCLLQNCCQKLKNSTDVKYMYLKATMSQKKLTTTNYVIGNILLCTVNITEVKLLNRDVPYG